MECVELMTCKVDSPFPLLCKVPRRTEKEVAPEAQCAAVKIHSGCIKEPPQNKLFPAGKYRLTAACHGN